MTNANGQVTFTYTGSGGTGTDSISATFVDSNGATEESNVVSKTWTPGVTVRKTAVEIGNIIYFTINYSNPTPFDAFKVVIYDNVPTGGTVSNVTHVGPWSGGANPTTVAGMKVFHIGMVPASVSGSVSFHFNLDANMLDGTAFCNCATIFYYLRGHGKTFSSHDCYDGVVDRSAPPPPDVIYTGPVQFANGSALHLTATFATFGTGTPIVKKKLTFGLDPGTPRVQSCTGITNTKGTASCTINPVAQNTGPGTVRVAFAGDKKTPATALDTPVTVDFSNSDTLTYTGATTVTFGATATVSASLTDASTGAGLSGESLTFTLGGQDGQTCTGVTNGAGVASCNIASVSETVGPTDMEVDFAGNASYPPNSIDDTVTVAAPSVTVTNATWSSASGGTAKLAFAAQPAAPSVGAMATVTGVSPSGVRW